MLVRANGFERVAYTVGSYVLSGGLAFVVLLHCDQADAQSTNNRNVDCSTVENPARARCLVINKALGKRWQILDQVRATIRTERSKLAKSRSEFAQEREQIDKEKQRLRKCISEPDSEQCRSFTGGDTQRKLNDARQKLAEATRTIGNLKEELTALKASAESAGQAQSEATRLQGKVASLTTELREAREQLQQRNSGQTDLQRALAAAETSAKQCHVRTRRRTREKSGS